MSNGGTSQAETRATEDLVREYRCSLDAADSKVSLAVVHRRGGDVEFMCGERYCHSQDPLDRVAGADLLGQLGSGTPTFIEASVAVLVRLLDDADVRVLAAAATALGHRHSARAIPRLLQLAVHPDASVRLGVVHGISRFDDIDAAMTLARLCSDPDSDVRNWAAFGLGSMCDLDTPSLRDALVPLLDDSDAEIRGEALIGLAKRQDSRVKSALIRELQGEFFGSWCLEAAELLADATSLPLLESLRARLEEPDRLAFRSDFDSAIAVCTSKSQVGRQSV